jgi:Zn-dependent protease with chaperone function
VQSFRSISSLAALAVTLALPALAAAQSITIYEHIQFGGKSVTITSPTSQLDSFWNDQVSSLQITGVWELCKKKDFRDCRVFDAEATDLRQVGVGWNDEVTSLRPLAEQPAAPLSSSAPAAAGVPVDAAAVPRTAPSTAEAETAAGAPAASTSAPAPSAPAPAASASASAPAATNAPNPRAAAFAGKPAAVKGYLEYRKGDELIVEGQRLVSGKKTKFSGSGEVKSLSSVPLGYMVEASGVRRADGAIEIARIDAKPNGQQLYESDVKQATDQLEATWRAQGQMLTAAGDGGVASMGKMLDSGPEYDRARGIVDRVLPAYIPADSVRVYVVDNPEWNAMAMGNYSIYVFTGIMTDLDDDELALVIGHEIAHASHEHSRKQAKRGMLTNIAAVGAGVLIGSELDGGEAYAASILTTLGVAAFANGYSRDQEDQADRVGMRYAYEGGYDVSKGPALWKKFADKYGEAGKAQNILFGDHSRSSVRATALDQEIALNYSVPAQ